ncbi:Signal transduction histidine kinase, core [Syntrophomonas zehnderi OL-4]|uniref:histidine kinase n=1 Tax=Syntrophomonas zehnderi OL-4 TaxID=690567 RepID=A0A0E3W2F0_9FIRM|nr:sensor histidine kinase [Syntrophomonas zehnderi]CFW96935.1 Signal transduction histidine kinase, core [Syntrophomonas zehnderi OL-4]
MKMKEYLADQIGLIVFYLLLMVFITAVIYLDPSFKVWTNNIIYLNVVALVLFCMYLLGSYLIKKVYYTQVIDAIQGEEEEIIHRLPAARSYEQKLFRILLQTNYDQQNSRIEKILADKKDNFEFISSWVHEIKTPIAVSKLIIENNTDNTKDEILNSLGEEIDRIDRLVEQVLYYSKVDDFSRDYFIHELDLSLLVSECVKKHAKIFIAKKIRIEIYDLDIMVTTDRKWLLFILDQILFNALKYTAENGVIKIFAAKDEGEKRLMIMDNGIGIRNEDLERVFDRGFTGYNGREFNKSTGMGLYLARRLARKLGHDISINSVYGEYTCIIIHFPKHMDFFNVAKPWR